MEGVPLRGTHVHRPKPCCEIRPCLAGVCWDASTDVKNNPYFPFSFFFQKIILELYVTNLGAVFRTNLNCTFNDIVFLQEIIIYP